MKRKPKLIISNNFITSGHKYQRKAKRRPAIVFDDGTTKLDGLLIVPLEDFEPRLPEIITYVRQMMRAKKAKARKETKCKAAKSKA